MQIQKRSNWQMREKNEDKLKRSVDNFKRKASESIAIKFEGSTDKFDSKAIKDIVDDAINNNVPEFGIKKKVDAAKKKILISQTRKDKDMSDLIYNFLIYNGVPAKEILYSNCDYEISRIPEDVAIFDYLRDFFVNSYSDQKIYVFFVTSENIKGSFGTMAEIGAAWITKADHKIINIKDFRPEKPLNDAVTWQNSSLDTDGHISMDKINADLFCLKIEDVCKKLGYTPKDRATNMTYLKSQVKIIK